MLEINAKQYATSNLYSVKAFRGLATEQTHRAGGGEMWNLFLEPSLLEGGQIR